MPGTVTEPLILSSALPNYWGEQPDVDEFTVKVIADPDAAILALRNGEVDLLAGTSR